MNRLLIWTAFALLAAGAAHAQSVDDYPNRPLRQIVPFPPGGGVDIVTRIVTAKWSEVLGQPIVVENRPGAGGNVGADRVTLGSDYCFDMGLDDPLATVNRIAGLSEEDKQRICGGNALKLLHL